MGKLVKQLYLPNILPAREAFLSRAGDIVKTPFGGTADELELFLVVFCCLGVRMTEPVESWILRAGEACEKLGQARLGRALKLHSRHEADHHLMMIEDAKTLTARWNEHHTYQLDVARLLRMDSTAAVDAYAALHEEVIQGSAPYCQIAIEFEIEGLSVSVGPGLMRNCTALLGSDIVSCLSFLKEHIAIDAGHTLFNEAELERLLAANSGYASQLVEAGARALETYADFLLGCFDIAKDIARRAAAANTASAAVTRLRAS